VGAASGAALAGFEQQPDFSGQQGAAGSDPQSPIRHEIIVDINVMLFSL